MEVNRPSYKESDVGTQSRSSSKITDKIDLCEDTDEQPEIASPESSKKADLDGSKASLVCYDTSSGSEDEANLPLPVQVVEQGNKNLEDTGYDSMNIDLDICLNQKGNNDNSNQQSECNGNTLAISEEIDKENLESLHSCNGNIAQSSSIGSIQEVPVICYNSEDTEVPTSSDCCQEKSTVSGEDMQIPRNSIERDVAILTGYRTQETIDISSGSETDSWSSDSEVDSDYSSTDSSESSAEEEEQVTSVNQEKTQSLPHVPQESKKAKNKKSNMFDEMDLPPIEDLHISVEESEAKAIGSITQIVDTQVVVQAYPDIPTIDLDSVLFLDCGQRCLGKVFDVFGPIQAPLYVVRFNSSDHIKEQGVEKGAQVYFAPRTEHTSYVMITELLNMRGSDASWKQNTEPPEELLDYSDDEKERKAKQARRLRKKGTEPVIIGEFESGRKKVRAERRNPFSTNFTQSRYNSASTSSTSLNHRNGPYSPSFGRNERQERQEVKQHGFWNRSQALRFGDPAKFRSPVSPYPSHSSSPFECAPQRHRDFNTNTPPPRPYLPFGQTSVNGYQFSNGRSPLQNLQKPPPLHTQRFPPPSPIPYPNMHTPPPPLTPNFPPPPPTHLNMKTPPPHVQIRPAQLLEARPPLVQANPPYIQSTSLVQVPPPHVQRNPACIETPPPPMLVNPPITHIPPPYVPSSSRPHMPPPPYSQGPPPHSQVGNPDTKESAQRFPAHVPPFIQNSSPSYMPAIPPPSLSSVLQGPPPSHSHTPHNLPPSTNSHNNRPPSNAHYYDAPPPSQMSQHQPFSIGPSTANAPPSTHYLQQPSLSFQSTQAPVFTQPPPTPNLAIPPPQQEHSIHSFHAPRF